MAMIRKGYARNRRASGTDVPAVTSSYRARAHRIVKAIMFRQDIVIDGEKKRQYLVRYDGQVESPISYQDLEELQTNTNAAQQVQLFDQLMDHGDDSFAVWQKLYPTAGHLDQIEVELMGKLTEYGKCLPLDLVAYFLIAFYLFHTEAIMSLFATEIRARIEAAANLSQTPEILSRRSFTLFLLSRLFKAIIRAEANPNDDELLNGSSTLYGVFDFMAMLARSIFPCHFMSVPYFLKGRE